MLPELRLLSERRYLMSVDPDSKPLLSWPWALALIVFLVVLCLALAQTVGG